MAATMIVSVGCSSGPELKGEAVGVADAMESAVVASIEDPIRSERAQATVHELRAELLEFYRSVSTARDEAFEISANYDATRADFAAVKTRLEGLRASTTEALIDLIIRLRTFATPEEWASINPIAAGTAEPARNVPE